MSEAVGFPAKGRSADDVIAEIRKKRADDADWKGGRTFSLVYHPDDPELDRLQEAVALEFMHENALNPFKFPSLLQMETEVAAMGAALVNGHPEGGKLTSGGTESIFLAVQASRDHARETRGVERPELLTADTAHPAFAKAAHYLAVEHVRVPVAADGRADVAAMRERINDQTMLVVGSAPCYPYGVIDPIPELAGAAAERDVLFHTDACLGGWMLPFWERLGAEVPPWDFRVDGVTSLSADLHKYGWCFKGASLVVYRDPALLHRQYFWYDQWPGGLYASGTTAGTRPAAPIAAAWATVTYLGEDGYLRLAKQVLDATRKFTDGINAIDGVRLSYPPAMSVMEFTSDEHDIFAIGDVMDDRGWHLDRQNGGLHLMLWPFHLHVVDQFLADLADAVANHGESRGVKARYS